MFFCKGLKGSDLPPKTVCLTFDDGPGRTPGMGPGPRSLELAAWLHRRGIPATFFVVGTHAVANKDILKQVAGMGHLIANHTFNHPNLWGYDGASAAKEILASHQVIAGFSAAPLAFFRPPFFSWSPNVAGALNWTSARRHIGPVMCDIDGKDWEFWQQGRDVRSCAAAYMDSIQQSGRGVILMHDSSVDEDIRRNCQTFEMAQIVVNWLLENDYRIVRLDSIPQITEAARVSAVIALRTADGHYLAPQPEDDGKVSATSDAIGPWEPWGVVELGGDKIALRCLTGGYLSPRRGGGGEVWAKAPAIGDWEVLTRVDLGHGAIALRCPNGDYFAAQPGGEVLANARTITSSEVLRVLTPA